MSEELKDEQLDIPKQLRDEQKAIAEEERLAREEQEKAEKAEKGEPTGEEPKPEAPKHETLEEQVTRLTAELQASKDENERKEREFSVRAGTMGQKKQAENDKLRSQVLSLTEKIEGLLSEVGELRKLKVVESPPEPSIAIPAKGTPEYDRFAVGKLEELFGEEAAPALFRTLQAVVGSQRKPEGDDKPEVPPPSAAEESVRKSVSEAKEAMSEAQRNDIESFWADAESVFPGARRFNGDAQGNNPDKIWGDFLKLPYTDEDGIQVTMMDRAMKLWNLRNGHAMGRLMQMAKQNAEPKPKIETVNSDTPPNGTLPPLEKIVSPKPAKGGPGGKPAEPEWTEEKLLAALYKLNYELSNSNPPMSEAEFNKRKAELDKIEARLHEE